MRLSIIKSYKSFHIIIACYSGMKTISACPYIVVALLLIGIPKPVMKDEAMQIIKNYYVDLRAQSQESVPFTPRQLEAFVRLAEASARVRLSQVAEVSDAKRAIAIINEYLRRVGMDRETGRFDIDIIATGRSHSQQQRMRSILDIIKKICSESKDGNADEKDIFTEAEIQGIDTLKVKNALERLVRDGQIYEPSHSRYRLTND